jgi:transcriptional antiterminator Rof (Rho-off)
MKGLRRASPVASPTYRPVDCSLCDQLDAHACKAQRCNFTYRDSSGAIIRASDWVETLFTRDGAEYLQLRSGAIIRLDALLELSSQP